MVPTSATSAVAGTTSTVVITNSGNISLPIGKSPTLKISLTKSRNEVILKNDCFHLIVTAQLIPGMKGLNPQNIRGNNASVTLAQVMYFIRYAFFIIK